MELFLVRTSDKLEVIHIAQLPGANKVAKTW
jgi:hypothetical protein